MSSIVEKTGKSYTVYGNTVAKDTLPKIHTFPTKAIYFDGSGDYFSLSHSSDFDFGSGDFTIDFWINQLGNAGGGTGHSYITELRDGNAFLCSGFILQLQDSGNLWFAATSNGSSWDLSVNAGNVIIKNSWNHVAVVRSGSSLSLYVNGISKASATTTLSIMVNAYKLAIGGEWVNTPTGINAMLSNFRISKDTARWTSDFTPPTSYTLDSYDKLFIGPTEVVNSKVFEDTATNKAITSYGNCKVVDLLKSVDKVMSFDGVGDCLILPQSDDWNFRANDFTVDLWIRRERVNTTEYLIAHDTVLDTSNFSWGIYIYSNNRVDYSTAIGSTYYSIINGSGYIADNNWHHVAMVRNGKNLYGFLDGVMVGSLSTLGANNINDCTLPLVIGKSNYSTPYYFLGSMFNIRITKGLARWTCNFVPPANPLETQLPIEIEKWTGREAVLWTKIPSVKTGFDTTLYLKVDKSNVDNNQFVGDIGEEQATRVWSNNYVGVYHLGQDPSGIAPQILDSTNRRYHGTTNGSMTSTDLIEPTVSQVACARGLDFDGSDDFITISDTNELSFDGTNEVPFSLEVLVKKSNSSASMGFLGKDDGSTNREWQFGNWTTLGNSTGLFIFSSPSIWMGGYVGNDIASKDNVWYATGTYDGSKSRDGFLVAQNSLVESVIRASLGTYTTIQNTSTPVTIGKAGGAATQGQMYEIRISRGIARNSSYFKATNAALFDSFFSYQPKKLLVQRYAGQQIGDIQFIVNEIDANTRLMLHMNGVEGSTSFIDSSNYGHTVTKYGDTKITDGVAYFDGNGAYLTVLHSNHLEFGSNDFTIDFWIKQTGNAGGIYATATLYAKRSSNAAIYASMLLRLNDDGTILLYVTSNGSSWDVLYGTILGKIVRHKWHHIAIVRSGSTWYGFINGKRQSTSTSSLGVLANSNFITIGGESITYPTYFNGLISRFRITKGVARWTSDFTPNTNSYYKKRTFGNIAISSKSKGIAIKTSDSSPSIADYKDRFDTILDLDRNELFVITPTYNGDRGVFGGGFTTVAQSSIDYIGISNTANSKSFGVLSAARNTMTATSNGSGDRGLFPGGQIINSSFSNVIDYITISVLDNAVDFGDMSQLRFSVASVSNNVNNRAIFGGGSITEAGSAVNTIDFVTITSLGNAADFGDLSIARWAAGSTSNGIGDRGIVVGGYSGSIHNDIDYVTISILCNAINFGDLTVSRYSIGATSNGILNKGVMAGGANHPASNVIDYLTISTLSNAADFGDLTIARNAVGSCSSGDRNRGVFAGGYTTTSVSTIDYVTIGPLSNALAFGSLSGVKHGAGGLSNA